MDAFQHVLAVIFCLHPKLPTCCCYLTGRQFELSNSPTCICGLKLLHLLGMALKSHNSAMLLCCQVMPPLAPQVKGCPGGDRSPGHGDAEQQCKTYVALCHHHWLSFQLAPRTPHPLHFKTIHVNNLTLPQLPTFQSFCGKASILLHKLEPLELVREGCAFRLQTQTRFARARAVRLHIPQRCSVAPQSAISYILRFRSPIQPTRLYTSF